MASEIRVPKHNEGKLDKTLCPVYCSILDDVVLDDNRWEFGDFGSNVSFSQVFELPLLLTAST